MRQAIVRFGGHEDGEDIFNLVFDRPPADPRFHGEMPTVRQRKAVDRFYCGFFGDDLAEDQVHALLTYRDYAQAAIAALLPDVSSGSQMVFSRFVAAFIGADPIIRDDIQIWLDRRFRDGADPDDLPKAISRTKHFATIRAFLIDARANLIEQAAITL